MELTQIYSEIVSLTGPNSPYHNMRTTWSYHCPQARMSHRIYKIIEFYLNKLSQCNNKASKIYMAYANLEPPVNERTEIELCLTLRRILREIQERITVISGYMKLVEQQRTSSTVTSSTPQSECENHEKGLLWFKQLVNLYCSLDGLLPLTGPSMVSLFKEKFFSMDHDDQQNVIRVFEDILGGISLENIAANLDSWIHVNMDAFDLEYSRKYLYKLPTS